MDAAQNYPDLSTATDFSQLALDIKQWGQDLGFQQLGITDTRLDEDEVHLMNWLKAGYHGKMTYMSNHGAKRSRPVDLVPGTLRIISARMNYLPAEDGDPEQLLQKPSLAYISRYSLGRDYHKVLRLRLQRLASRIEIVTGPFGYRVFVDSAPVLEKALAHMPVRAAADLVAEAAGLPRRVAYARALALKPGDD